MKRVIALSLVSLALATTPALAGNTSMKDGNGNKLRINCKNSGCLVQTKEKGGKWKKEKHDGGRENYLKLVDEYKKKGYK
ncbi:hypothetical protein NBRC116590_22960 [Pelagimonas sp. KU-00592-HH]|uniref:hypothetical protein n=1 Tax=Roseobacteraceae TaxID=2854170 RepID=UPI0020CF3346|nr:hypothetical protein [Shimia sp. CNT1-13L.2]MCP9480925.1 hypothetical protein [Shimia sp. CNT1-13L.2]